MISSIDSLCRHPDSPSGSRPGLRGSCGTSSPAAAPRRLGGRPGIWGADGAAVGDVGGADVLTAPAACRPGPAATPRLAVAAISACRDLPRSAARVGVDAAPPGSRVAACGASTTPTSVMPGMRCGACGRCALMDFHDAPLALARADVALRCPPTPHTTDDRPQPRAIQPLRPVIMTS